MNSSFGFKKHFSDSVDQYRDDIADGYSQWQSYISDRASHIGGGVVDTWDGISDYASGVKDSFKASASTSSKTVKHYWFGDGRDFNMEDDPRINKMLVDALEDEMEESVHILLERWKNNGFETVDSSKRENRNEWGDTVSFDATNEKGLFFLGDGLLYSYLHSDGEEATVHFYIRDKFKDPTDIGEVNRLITGRELPESVTDFSGTPYELNWDYAFPESFDRSDLESGGLIGMVGGSETWVDDSWFTI